MTLAETKKTSYVRLHVVLRQLTNIFFIWYTEMEDTKRIKLTRTTQLEDIPDGLIQHIQSLLPVKEAASTSVLSKSWQQAWSTNPTLRFRQYQPFPGKQQKRYMHMIDRTIQRYFRDNIAITSFKLHIVIDDDELASFVNKWIRKVVSKSCLTEINLKLEVINQSFQFQLSEEIFSGKNLEKVSLRIIANNPWSWTPITDTFASVRELCLELYDDNFRFSDLLKSKFPFLESLTLSCNGMEDNLDITCVSLKRLIIEEMCDRPLRVQVAAPKLLFFSYTCGMAVPSLLFATPVPDQIQLNLELFDPIDVCFFHNLREMLKLSSEFNIRVITRHDILKRTVIDIDDLRRQVPCPATNVQQLSFQTSAGEELQGYSEFFDSFFSICSPSYIKAICPTCKMLR